MADLRIAKDTVVAFSYVLSDESGAEIEKSAPDQPTVYLHGRGNLMAGIEEALVGRAVGEEVTVTLAPERAYGARQNEALQRIPIKHLLTKARRYTPGMIVKVNTPEGPRNVVIVKAGKFNVDVDLNHPLAGKTVTFNVKIQQIREATQEERAHGHAHGVAGEAGHP